MTTSDQGNGKPDALRLQLFLARAGIASRRASEELIRAGRVKVNGKTVTEQGVKVTPGDSVEFDGRRIHLRTQTHYYMLNKPRGYVCTNADPEGRPLAVDLVAPLYNGKLHSIGRLDFNSSGLIIFTNDGEFTNKVSHPSSGIEKEYVVDAQDPVSDEMIEAYTRGIDLDGDHIRAASITRKGESRVHIVLTGGRNREIRRVFAHFGHGIRRLHRIRLGGLEIGRLPSGEARELSRQELARILSGRKRPQVRVRRKKT